MLPRLLGFRTRFFIPRRIIAPNNTIAPPIRLFSASPVIFDEAHDVDSNGSSKVKRKNAVGTCRVHALEKLWEYIKGNELQDPDNQRYILCDQKMRLVFKTNRMHILRMKILLNQNLSPLENQGKEPEDKV